MAVARRVYMSMPTDRCLAPSQNELKWGIVEEIEQLGYTPEIFFDPRRGKPGLSSGKAWSMAEADKVARHCVGAAVIGLPRWNFHTPEGDDIKLPTEFCYYEGAVAYTLGLPMLVVAQEDVFRRVLFDMSYGPYISLFPPNADRSWLGTDDFRVPFDYWRSDLTERRDVFLGYCSSSTGPAQNLKRFLEMDIGATVLDWQTDFAPGRTILQQIETAAARCSAGIFLFTKDDNLTDDTHADKAVPRDNVIFEAGYFVNAKGKDHVLIVRQAGTKLPADLGGDIYASLEDKSDIGRVEDPVRRFVAQF
jgi:hypothetical protein